MKLNIRIVIVAAADPGLEREMGYGRIQKQRAERWIDVAGDWRVLESGTNEENNGDMRKEGRRVDLSGPCPIWEERKANSVGRLGICYRSQLPMMPKSKRGQERVSCRSRYKLTMWAGQEMHL